MPGREIDEFEEGPSNALMRPVPRRYADPAPEQRGFLLPLRVPRGGYQSEPGTWARFAEGVAVPGIIYEPFAAANALMSPNGQYRPGTEDAEGVALALQAAGIGGAGALATRPPNALTSGFARRSLPTDRASRMERAEALGFDTAERQFHGTTRGFRGFDLDRAPPQERAVWVTPDPEVAGHFARYEAGYASDGSRTRVLPLHVRGRQRVIDREYLEREYGPELARRSHEDPDFAGPLAGEPGTILWHPEYFQRELERARRDGYDSVRFVRVEEGMGPPADQIAVFDPANVRSTNARFNPRYSGSANLLSANPAPAVAATLMPAESD